MLFRKQDRDGHMGKPKHNKVTECDGGTGMQCVFFLRSARRNEGLNRGQRKGQTD